MTVMGRRKGRKEGDAEITEKEDEDKIDYYWWGFNCILNEIFLGKHIVRESEK